MDLIASNQSRKQASQEGCSAQEIETAWRSRGRDAAMTELIASNRVRKQARQQGCLAQEIGAAWSSAAGGRGAALNALIAQHSNWRAKELPQQLAATDVAGLVEHAERTGSIGRDALEEAWDDDAPKQALAQLLLATPEFVAEQRGLHVRAVEAERRRRQEAERRRQEEERRRQEEERRRGTCRFCKNLMPTSGQRKCDNLVSHCALLLGCHVCAASLFLSSRGAAHACSWVFGLCVRG